MSELSYSFDWRRDEHARAVALLVRELFSRGVRRVLKCLVIAILVVEGIYVIAMVGLGDVDTVRVLIALVAIVIPMVAAFYRITGFVRAWQVGRSDPNVHHPIVHRLNDAGYRVITHTATIDLRWDGLYKVRESPDFFLIHYSRRYAYLLPMRGVSMKEAERVRTWIRDRLPDRVCFERDS